MQPLDFVNQFYPFAKKVEDETGLPALFVVAQCALETGWGESVAGNNMFGIKDSDGLNGNEQLVATLEFHSKPDQKYPVILSIEEVVTGKRWKYRVKDWFRKYPTPYESFADHAKLLLSAKRYKSAWEFSMKSANPNPEEFAKTICRAGYATAPNYEETILLMMKSVRKRLSKDGKPLAPPKPPPIETPPPNLEDSFDLTNRK